MRNGNAVSKFWLQIGASLIRLARHWGQAIHFRLCSISEGNNQLDGQEKQSQLHARQHQWRDQAIKRVERVKLLGEKKKDKDGHLTFRVKKVKQDYGPCD